MTNRRRVKQLVIASAVALLGLAFLVIGTARAQDGPPQSVEQAPGQPTGSAQVALDAPGVARVSFIHGDVSMQRGDSGEASDVTLNTPLEAGDKILTGTDSRTELELDAADILRLDQNAEANIATLANNRVQVQVGQGVASYSVLKGGSADVEIDTPNVAVHPLKEGRYRVQVNANGDTEVIVRDGEADVSTPQGSTKVHKGDLITIRGTASDAQYKVTSAPSTDDFDTWNKDRDAVIYNAHAWQNTNHNYTGAGDLDGYGVWDEVPDYGQVWVPSVDVGWAPYRAGSWVYEPYWGWTWVSSEPWGWAPYHYGRWFMYGNRWAWWPGPVYGGYRPIWAPAYVSFFGFGGGVGVNFGFGFGFGSIGWLPIGPCDYFHPWWGGFRDRFAVVDFNHFRDLHEGFAPLHGGDRFSNLRGVTTNDRLRAGVSGVAAGSFGHGAISPRSVSAEEFRGARAMTGNLPVVPGRDSLRVSNRPVNASLAARANQQQHFYSRMTPGTRPESFSQASSHVQESLQHNNIQFHGNAEASSRSANPGVTTGGRSVGASPSYRPPTSQDGRVQGQFGRGDSAANANTRSQSADGWNRFGGGQAGAPESRSGSAPRGFQGQGEQQGGSRGTTQPADRPQESGRPQIYQGSAPRSYEGQGRPQNGWQRFSTPNAESSARAGGNQGGSYRPPLSMSKPIVTQRSPAGNSGYSEPNQGRYGYSGGSGGRSYSSAPSPAYRTAPSYHGGGGASGGYRSAPSGGGRGGSSSGSSGGHGGGGHPRR